MFTPDLANWRRNQEVGFSEENVPAELWAAHTATMSFESELQSNWKDELESQEIPPALYHYTDIRGMQGMFSSYMMWLSDAAYMNDPLEGSWAHHRAKSVANEILGSSIFGVELKSHIEYYLNAPDILDQAFRQENKDERFYYAAFRSATRPAFIASFTEADDVLSQWRGYGDSGSGVAIGFDLNKIELCAIPVNGLSVKPTVIKVEYDQKAQDDELRRIFSTAKNIHQNFSTTLESNPHAQDIFVQNLTSVVIDALYRLRWKYKSPLYAEEKEWRLVAKPFGPPMGSKTRTSGNFVVPYIEMPLPQETSKPLNRLAIPRIVLGPTCSPLTIRSLRHQLQNLAFPIIERSRLSLR